MCCCCIHVPTWIGCVGCSGNMSLNVWLLIGTIRGVIPMIALQCTVLWFIAHLTNSTQTIVGGLSTSKALASCILLWEIVLSVAARVGATQFATIIFMVASYYINSSIVKIKGSMMLFKSKLIMQQVPINLLKIYRIQSSCKRGVET